MIAPIEALAAIPDGLAAAEAPPLLCAGVTTFNALRHSGALPGDLCAISLRWDELNLVAFVREGDGE